jgi:hypothetical protein
MTDKMLLFVFLAHFLLMLYIIRAVIQLQKRYRSIDIRLSNNNEWVLMNYKSISESLEKMHTSILNSYPGGRIVDIARNAEQASKAVATFLEREPVKQQLFRSNEQKASAFYRQDIPNQVMQEYYSSLVQELQQLNKVMNQHQEYDYDSMYNSKL